MTLRPRPSDSSGVADPRRRRFLMAGIGSLGMLGLGWAAAPKKQRLIDTVTAMERDDGMSAVIVGAPVKNAAGTIQVQVTLVDSHITDVELLQNGTTRMESEQINAEAFPILIEEVLQEQTWNVAWVSGATATSEAFTESARDALSQAGM